MGKSEYTGEADLTAENQYQACQWVENSLILLNLRKTLFKLLGLHLKDNLSDLKKWYSPISEMGMTTPEANITETVRDRG